MPTVFGFTWRIAEYTEVILAFVIALLIIGFYLLLRYNQYVKNKKNQSYQLFLFKTKQLGLSNFQNKILNGIITTLELSDPGDILDNSELFESAIGNFLSYLKSRQEREDSLAAICKDLIITYEKLYHPTSFKNPLENLADIENKTLLYVITRDNTVFIGKIINREELSFTLEVFRTIKEISKITADISIDVFLWRAGDAEYSFQSKILSVEGNRLKILIPEEFNRGKEVRHPYIDVIIPSLITEITAAGEPAEAIKNNNSSNIVVYKLHEDELIARVSKKLDYRKTYTLNFVLSDFKMKITAIIIADRTLREENVFYYTFRFTEVSDAAKNILKTYIAAHR